MRTVPFAECAYLKASGRPCHPLEVRYYPHAPHRALLFEQPNKKAGQSSMKACYALAQKRQSF